MLPHYKLILLITLVGCGVFLQLSGIIDLDRIIGLARQYADHWWLIALLITVQTVLFTFALAGSSMVWITAALFTPISSSLIITTGTTLGGIAAYVFSARLSDDWTRKVKASRVYQLLQKEGSFFNLLALRVMPGFPHSVINYSSGILKLNLINFISTAIAGTAIKTYVYSRLIYNATSPGTLSDNIDISTVWPLLALSMCLLIITLIKHYLDKK